MARCGCNVKCTCIVQVSDGACLNLSVSGSGNTDAPYTISGEILVDGVTIVCGANGLEAHVQTLDTDTIDFTGDGSLATPLKADAILTPDNTGVLAGTPDGGVNLLKAGGPGLYVSCEDIQDCVGQAVQVTAGDCLIYDDANNTINVEISPEPNGVECSPTGLLVTPSTDAGNAIVFGTDNNLYAPGSAPFQVVDTPCVDLTVTGAGIIGDPQVLSANPILDPNPCNALICGGAGMLVPQVDITAQLIQPGPAPGLGSPCLAVQETPGCPDAFLITLALSDDPCQSLECRPDGLWAPRARGESCISNGIGGGSAPQIPAGGLNAGQSLTWFSNAINICNSGCCTSGGMLQIDFSGLTGRVKNGSVVTMGVQNNVNGGGFTNAFPFNERTIDTFQNTGTAASTKQYALWNTDSFKVSLGPGQCETYQAKITVSVIFGGIASFQATQFGGMNAEIVYTLIPLCDCQCLGTAPSC